VRRFSDAAVWPVDLIPAEEGGFIVNFPDLPNGWSQSDARQEVLARAEGLLDEMILRRVAHYERIPRPLLPQGRPVMAPPALTVAELEAYRVCAPPVSGRDQWRRSPGSDRLSATIAGLRRACARYARSWSLNRTPGAARAVGLSER
jgi:predicted RNase H-like HicB family nuclease